MARTAKKRQWSDWSPEYEERQFQELASKHYIANCLDARTEAYYKALRASVDGALVYAAIPAEGCALDVGAGEGWATTYLRELGFNALGVERSPDVAARAPEGTVLLGNAQDLPVESESQDFVLCNSIFEHVLDPDKVMSEIARVLKPGGRSMLTTTNRWHPMTGEISVPLFPYMPRRLRDRLWRRSDRMHITPHFFTYRQMRRMAAENGLECESVVDLKLATSTSGRGDIGRRITSIPGGKSLLEARVGVVMVRLTKLG